MLVASVVIAVREDDKTIYLDLQHEEVGKSDQLWDDVNGRFTKVSDEPRDGSFGMTWLVKDSQLAETKRKDEIFALKLFHYERRLLSIKSTISSGFKINVMQGYKECAMQQHLVEQGKRASHIGAQRFISCHETNIPPEDDEKWSSSSEDPLWVLMEYGGDRSLFDWIHSGRWTAELAKQLFKQLMEGLSFLASMSPAYTHHDLKPDNCVIKETQDGSLVLNIIDFGGAAEISQATRFGPALASTPGYTPWEMGERISREHPCPPPPSAKKETHQQFASCQIDQCGSRCGLAFDMFAAGQIWFDMMLGSPSDTWGYDADETRTINFLSVIEGFKERTGDEDNEFEDIVTELKTDNLFWNDIQSSVDMMLLEDPAMRIQAQEVLEKKSMKRIKTPNEKDYTSEMGQHAQIPSLLSVRQTVLLSRKRTK